MLTEVIARLDALGYKSIYDESPLILPAIRMTEEYISREYNMPYTPPELIPAAIDMVCGEFLLIKKQSGQHSEEARRNLEFNLGAKCLNLDMTEEAPVKQIQEGDTSVTFAVADSSQTQEKRLDSLIEHLISGAKSQFMPYRRIRW